MYSIGTKVVHPCYGAGTIVRIQEKSIGDISNAYYIIATVCTRSMQVMVPVRRAEVVGLRQVGEPCELRSLLISCQATPLAGEAVLDLRARQAAMRERLKSGHFSDVLDVVRTLHHLSTKRPLGTVDRQLFDQGKEFLAGELALASDVRMEDALQEVEGNLGAQTAD